MIASRIDFPGAIVVTPSPNSTVRSPSASEKDFDSVISDFSTLSTLIRQREHHTGLLAVAKHRFGWSGTVAQDQLKIKNHTAIAEEALHQIRIVTGRLVESGLLNIHVSFVLMLVANSIGEKDLPHLNSSKIMES